MDNDITTQSLEFDKFIKDIEKRENKNAGDFQDSFAKEHYDLKRRREELYREKWQNSIVWSEKWATIILFLKLKSF